MLKRCARTAAAAGPGRDPRETTACNEEGARPQARDRAQDRAPEALLAHRRNRWDESDRRKPVRIPPAIRAKLNADRSPRAPPAHGPPTPKRRRQSGRVGHLQSWKDQHWKARRQASTNFCSICENSHESTFRRDTSKRSTPAGTRFWCLRKTSRSRRLALARSCAGPTAEVEAMTPTRAPENGKAPGAVATEGCRKWYQRVKAPHSKRRPFSRASRKSFCRRTCCSGRKRITGGDPDAQGRHRNLKRPSGACDPSYDGQR